MMDGRMIGAAAAHVLIGQLQAQFSPLLESLPAGSRVVDQNNVVIAMNSGNQHRYHGEIVMRGKPWT